MPNCYSLTKKGESHLSKLADVDDAMRAHFGAPPDPVNWYKNWENIEGWAFAMGWDREKFDKVFNHNEAGIRDNDRLEIWDWIHENYEVAAWVEIGRR